MNKYRNIKTCVNGIRFDSKRESERYSELLILEKAGDIKDLVLQPRFVLQEGFVVQGKRELPVKYIADFQYTETASGKTIVEDVKGMETQSFKIKRKWFLHKFGGLYDFRIIK